MSGLDRAAERIERVAGSSAGDARTVRLVLLDELRRAVGFDAHAWLLTDPETEVGCAPVADVPCLPELPRLIGLKYRTTVNRWTSLAAPVGRLADATGGDLGRSLMWRELLCGYGVTDVASVVLRDRFGCWAFLDLWRSGPREAFTGAEAAFLARIAPAVTTALRRCQARTFDDAPGPAPERGPIVLVLTPTLEVEAQTAEADAFLRALVPPDGDRRPVPAAAYNVAAQLLAVEAGVDAHPPLARVHLAGGAWLTLRAARMGAPGGGGDPDVAVTVEASSTSERVDVFVRAFGLSPREAEVVACLVDGLATREVAGRLFVSGHTVQDHLKSVFDKTGARSRRSLLARATGR